MLRLTALGCIIDLSSLEKMKTVRSKSSPTARPSVATGNSAEPETTGCTFFSKWFSTASPPICSLFWAEFLVLVESQGSYCCKVSRVTTGSGQFPCSPLLLSQGDLGTLLAAFLVHLENFKNYLSKRQRDRYRLLPTIGSLPKCLQVIGAGLGQNLVLRIHSRSPK